MKSNLCKRLTLRWKLLRQDSPYINTERPSCNLNANGHGAIGPARGFVKAMLDMIRLWYGSSDHVVLVQRVWRVMAGVCWTPRHIQMIVDVLPWQKLMANPPSAWSETANTVRPKTSIDDFDVIFAEWLADWPSDSRFLPQSSPIASGFYYQ